MMNALDRPQPVSRLGSTDESLLIQAVEAAGDAIVLMDRQAVVTYVNGTAERLLGVPRSELIGTSWRHRRWHASMPDGTPVPPDQQADKRALELGQPTFGMERAIIRPDGSKVVISGNTIPLRDEHGQVVGLVVTATDISSHVRIEQELRGRTEYFRALVVNSADAICLVDPQGFLTFATPSAERILGYRPDELVGMLGFELVVAEERERAQAIMADALAHPDQVITNLHRMRHKSGEVVTVEAVVSNKLAEPAVQAIVVNFRDVSEREAAAHALRQSEERYRVLFERNLAGVFRSRMDGTVLDCNDAFARIFGIESRAEMLRRNTHDFDRSPADRHKFMTALEAQGNLTNYESPMRRRDGTLIWVLENVTLRSESGALVQEGTIIDITDRRRVEEQQRQAHKMEAFGQLAGGVAHDFNNLLTAILGNLALAQKQLAADQPCRELLAEAEQAGWRAAELTAQMLDFARSRPLHLEPLHLLRAIDETVAILRRSFDPRIAIDVLPATDLWTVKADGGQVNQVVMNLCLNARDALPEGGRITVEAVNVQVTDADAARNVDAKPGEFVRLRVCDNGQGIPHDIRPRVFEPFFTTKPPGQGTGLGLAMAFGIVRQHGGWIECNSEVGKGSRFDVYLPRSLSIATISRGAAGSAVGGHETILLVDDEAMIRRLAETLLTQLGYRVALAEDGIAALDIYQRDRDKIDLVILDLTMPRLSGRDTFLRLRQMNPNVRVLFSSGFSAEALCKDEIADAAGFVNKPYRLADLTRAVRDALEQPKCANSFA